MVLNGGKEGRKFEVTLAGRAIVDSRQEARETE